MELNRVPDVSMHLRPNPTVKVLGKVFWMKLRRRWGTAPQSIKHFIFLSFLFACTESSTQDERLTVDLSSCLDSLDGWSQFLECAQRPNQANRATISGCFVWVSATERGWQSLTLVNGDWTSDPNGSQSDNGGFDEGGDASFYVGRSPLSCADILPGTQCDDLDGCIVSLSDGRIDESRQVVTFSGAEGCSVQNGLLGLDSVCDVMNADGGIQTLSDIGSNQRSSDLGIMNADVATSMGEPRDAEIASRDMAMESSRADMGTPVHNGQPECGNGVIEADEECDDGNQTLEPCETPDLNCLVCNPQCREERVLNPSCGNGVHEPHERCDLEANNVHAEFCGSRCNLDFSRRAGGGSGSVVPPLTWRAQVLTDPAYPLEQQETVELDFWVFHPLAEYDDGLSSFDFAFSELSTSLPMWMAPANLDESNKTDLTLTINGTNHDCGESPMYDANRGEDLILALSARALARDPATEVVIPAEVVVRLTDGEGNEEFSGSFIFEDDDDVFAISVYTVCRQNGSVRLTDWYPNGGVKRSLDLDL